MSRTWRKPRSPDIWKDLAASTFLHHNVVDEQWRRSARRNVPSSSGRRLYESYAPARMHSTAIFTSLIPVSMTTSTREIDLMNRGLHAIHFGIFTSHRRHDTVGLHRIDRSDTIHRRINGISCIGQQSGKHVRELLIVNHEHRTSFWYGA